MARLNQKINLAVTGCGLVSSLGLDVANVCAAARAGITRAGGMDSYPVRSSADGTVAGVVCHSVPFLTDGFEGEPRLVRLIQGGLEDLIRQCPATPWKARRTLFYLSLPSEHRLVTGAELDGDEDARKEMVEAAKEIRSHTADMVRATRLLRQGAHLAGWPDQPLLKWCTESGNAGVSEAIRQAADDLGAGLCDLAVVGGVDSLLDEDTLAWLDVTARLKTKNTASGLQPGEGCGFLILQTATATSDSKAPILARVIALCVGDESKPLLAGDPSSATGLTAVVTSAIDSVSAEKPFPIWVIHDHNGELYRANEWGITQFHLASMWTYAQPVVWFPAVSVGDVGAATGAVHACFAMAAFQRGYSPTHFAALITGSETATRTCMILAATSLLPP